MAKHNEIPAAKPAATDSLPLRLSFKYLDLAHSKFAASKCCVEYFTKLFETLAKFSNWTVGDFIDQDNQERRHSFDFAQTSESEGFRHIPNVDSDQLGYHEGWQFSVYPGRQWNTWRAHGILVNDTFYLVWLDPDHLLFPILKQLKE